MVTDKRAGWPSHLLTPQSLLLLSGAPTHTEVEGGLFQLPPPGEGSGCLFICVLWPWFIAFGASSAPFVPQRPVLLLRAHQEWRLSQPSPAHCPSCAQAAWEWCKLTSDFRFFPWLGPRELPLLVEGWIYSSRAQESFLLPRKQFPL